MSEHKDIQEQKDKLNTTSAKTTEQKKKTNHFKLAVTIEITVVLAAVLIALVVNGFSRKPEVILEDGNVDDVTCKGSYSVSDEEAAEARDTVVATIGEHQLTNGLLHIYYWTEVWDFVEDHAGDTSPVGLDYSIPLDAQLKEKGKSWQQYFLDVALSTWWHEQAMTLMAQKAGFTMSHDNKTHLENLVADLEKTAANKGISMEKLILDRYGSGAEMEDYRHFQELNLRSTSYYEGMVNQKTPTQGDLKAYFMEHEAEYAERGITIDGKLVDFRHILVLPKEGATDKNGKMTYSEKQWAACEVEAQAILDTWLTGEKTEGSFTALAIEMSEDIYSQENGGLYQQMYFGQAAQEFQVLNDWCFEANRKPGDYDLLKSEIGYHVIYFVRSQPQWLYHAQSDWRNNRDDEIAEDIAEKYPMDVTFANIVLGVAKMNQ